MTTPAKLQTLLKELNCKIPLEDIPLSTHETIAAFLEQEKAFRCQHRIQRLLANSGINKNQIRTFEQFDWNFSHSIPKQDILAFRNSQWIENASNLVLIGDAGIGKTHLAKALCFDAINAGYTTFFSSAFDLLSKITKTPHPSTKIDYLAKNIKVLCIDELGYTFHQKEDTDLLFQIISKRSETAPTIVTSNLPPKQWGSIFSGTAASAILDRLNFNGKFLTWEGKSYRARHNKLK